MALAGAGGLLLVLIMHLMMVLVFLISYEERIVLWLGLHR